jgi:hypothetical protein
LRMQEVADAAGMIESTVDEDAQIIWGTTVDPNFPPDQVKITLLATGITVMRPKVLHPMRPGFGNNDNGNEIRGLNSGIGNDRSARPLPTPPNTPQPPLSGRPVTGSQSTVPDAPPANSGNRSGGGSILGLRSPLDGRRRTDSSTDRIPNDDVDLSVPPHMRKNPPR